MRSPPSWDGKRTRRSAGGSRWATAAPRRRRRRGRRGRSSAGSVCLTRKPAGAGAQGVEDVLVELERGQDQHPHGGQRGRRRRSPRVAVEPVDPRHADVHQHDVGSLGRSQVDGRLAVAGLADDLDVVLGVERARGTRPARALVVGEDDADHADPAHVTRDRNPPPGRGPASQRPPVASARSRIPTSPMPVPPAPAVGPGPVVDAPRRVSSRGPAVDRAPSACGVAGVPDDVGQRLPARSGSAAGADGRGDGRATSPSTRSVDVEARRASTSWPRAGRGAPASGRRRPVAPRRARRTSSIAASSSSTSRLATLDRLSASLAAAPDAVEHVRGDARPAR